MNNYASARKKIRVRVYRKDVVQPVWFLLEGTPRLSFGCLLSRILRRALLQSANYCTDTTPLLFSLLPLTLSLISQCCALQNGLPTRNTQRRPEHVEPLVDTCASCLLNSDKHSPSDDAEVSDFFVLDVNSAQLCFHRLNY